MIKRISIIILILSSFHFAQDVIYKTDGSEIKSKVVEITPDVIKYKKFENLDGPLYNIYIKEVFMIVYENGQREVFKKSPPATPEPSQTPVVEKPDTTPTPPPPPPVKTESENTTTPQMASQKSDYVGVYLIGGMSASFMIGSWMPQSIEIEQIIDGDKQTATLDNPDSQFKFTANVTWQDTQNMAFLFGGTVEKLNNGNMSYYYLGGSYFFSANQFSPFAFARIGYGFGTVEYAYLNKDISLNGFFSSIGLGTKLYLGNTWGVCGEFGYQYQTINADEEVTEGRQKTKIELAQTINGFGFVAGIFFYP